MASHKIPLQPSLLNITHHYYTKAQPHHISAGHQLFENIYSKLLQGIQHDMNLQTNNSVKSSELQCHSNISNKTQKSVRATALKI